MKTSNLILTGLVLLSVGCASEKSADPASKLTSCGQAYCETLLDVDGDGDVDTPTGTGTDPAVTGYASGSTASLNLNGSALGRLFYNSQPRNPTNVRINISLSSNSEAVIISYVEGNVLKEAAFGTVNPINPNVSNAKYNGWIVEGGQTKWKGFFQDRYGAIVLIVDNFSSQGDGQPATTLGGSVWFQNFTQSIYDNPNQGPLKMCWDITMGPYDCRTFIQGNAVVVTSSATPNNRGPNKTVSYERLANFGGISRSAAGF